MSARLWALIAVSLLGVTTASATLISVDAGSLQVLTRTIDIPLLLEATVDGTLAKLPDGDGVSLDIRIELPFDVDPTAIDVASIRLCRDAPACADGLAPQDTSLVGDADDNGVSDVIVAFKGVGVSRLIAEVVSSGAMNVTVSGHLRGSDRWFSGGTTVMIASAPR